MTEKILIINSSAEKNRLLTKAFKELRQKNFSFSLWSSRERMITDFRRYDLPAKKVFLGPNLKNGPSILLFLLCLPLFQLKYLFSLGARKLKRQTGLIVCLGINEKIIITPPARLLGLKIVWLETPELNYRQLNRLLLKIFRLNSRLVKIGAFNNYLTAQLKNLGCAENKLESVPPGTKLDGYQENIFNKLASADGAGYRRKYFTVGAVTALNQKQKIEAIFQAVKICQAVIPNIQLIIAGEGEERKNLLWLAKKMQIENLVWLVGEQEHLKKWLDSFDIFLASGDRLNLDDYGNILEAMAAGLPVLAPRNIGLEDIVVDNKTGALIEAENSELLARQIIKLHQDKRLRLFLGKNGQERVNRFFTLDKMAQKLEHLFNAVN
ncbi:MAG: glycosyltransferase family 4 protein [bacterium]|nr:glycosyltransferase family 4 protein [bacterium]